MNIFTIILFILIPFVILGHAHWGWILGTFIMHILAAYGIKLNHDKEMKKLNKRLGKWD